MVRLSPALKKRLNMKLAEEGRKFQELAEELITLCRRGCPVGRRTAASDSGGPSFNAEECSGASGTGQVNWARSRGFIAADIFLRRNGYEIHAAQPEIIAFVLSVAAGEADEEVASQWISEHRRRL